MGGRTQLAGGRWLLQTHINHSSPWAIGRARTWMQLNSWLPVGWSRPQKKSGCDETSGQWPTTGSDVLRLKRALQGLGSRKLSAVLYSRVITPVPAGLKHLNRHSTNTTLDFYWCRVRIYVLRGGSFIPNKIFYTVSHYMQPSFYMRGIGVCSCYVCCIRR